MIEHIDYLLQLGKANTTVGNTTVGNTEQPPPKAHKKPKNSPVGLILATLCTYTVSAVWHGFYGGYYLTFLTGAYVSLCEPAFHGRLVPFIVGCLPLRIRHSTVMAWMGRFLLWALAQITVGYTVTPFMVLTWDGSIGVWRACHFAIHWLWGILLVLSLMVPRPKAPIKTE
jgi:lysophospholipid acyltransferase